MGIEGVGMYLASRLIARLGSCCHAVVAKVFQAEVLSLLPCLLAYRWGFAHTCMDSRLEQWCPESLEQRCKTPELYPIFPQVSLHGTVSELKVDVDDSQEGRSTNHAHGEKSVFQDCMGMLVPVLTFKRSASSWSRWRSSPILSLPAPRSWTCSALPKALMTWSSSSEKDCTDPYSTLQTIPIYYGGPGFGRPASLYRRPQQIYQTKRFNTCQTGWVILEAQKIVLPKNPPLFLTGAGI